jgi:hypothetical protein
MLKVVWIKGKDRGTIATKKIEKGDLIEASPTCSFPPEQRELIDKTSLFEYYFVRQSEYSDANKWVNGYIVFGLTSLCNHSKKPNARIQWIEDKCGLWTHLIAIESIDVAEEVTISYTNIEEYPPTKDFI